MTVMYQITIPSYASRLELCPDYHTLVMNVSCCPIAFPLCKAVCNLLGYYPKIYSLQGTKRINPGWVKEFYHIRGVT